MAPDSDQIRLPELPIFKKYSLAVRQEFASPKELMSILASSMARVEKAVARATPEPESAAPAVAEEFPATVVMSPNKRKSVPTRKPSAHASKPKPKRKPASVVRVSHRGTPVRGASKKKRTSARKKTATRKRR